MKALLDTNIIIHRETSHVCSQDIGILYKWIERRNYEKVIHPVTLDEIRKYQDQDVVRDFLIKMEGYERIVHPSPLAKEVMEISTQVDNTENDKQDSVLLNEVYVGRVDILITEDKKIHKKADLLGIGSKVFTIDTFLELAISESPQLEDYPVLNVRKMPFAKVDLSDPFFDSLKTDYAGFEGWFVRKYDEDAYITLNAKNQHLLSFLYLKIETENERYDDIVPTFAPKKRLKIGTFKVVSNGLRLGERFLKIIFDNALKNKVDEVYVTIFDRSHEQRRLIDLLEVWGFVYWGMKGEEKVYIRDFRPNYNSASLLHNYPYVSRKHDIYLVAIYPEYHTELLPDSILTTESPLDFVEDRPYRNAIRKVFISRSFNHPRQGDILVFYRTGGFYKGVVTTIGVVQEVRSTFADEQDFISYCKNISVFPEDKLRKQWNYKPSKPFVVHFLYVYSFPHRINLKELIDLGVLGGIDDAPRGFRRISLEQFDKILKATKSDESFIID